MLDGAPAVSTRIETIDRLKAVLADRYAIERKIGSGGMADAYLTHDVRHNRKVAIKVMHRDLAELIGVERFLLEIETTAKLQHPHILPLLDKRRRRLRSASTSVSNQASRPATRRSCVSAGTAASCSCRRWATAEGNSSAARSVGSTLYLLRVEQGLRPRQVRDWIVSAAERFRFRRPEAT